MKKGRTLGGLMKVLSDTKPTLGGRVWMIRLCVEVTTPNRLR